MIINNNDENLKKIIDNKLSAFNRMHCEYFVSMQKVMKMNIQK